jgi:hypothetical protein
MVIKKNSDHKTENLKKYDDYSCGDLKKMFAHLPAKNNIIK